jgi:nitrous oxidase accessory protein NosD
MGRSMRAALVAAVIAAFLGAASASAAAKTVCSEGCAFSSIQTAINAASPGATITIGKGTYVENLVVDKPLKLEGAGMLTTAVEPAVSNPVCSPGSLCSGAASNIVLVQADDVTITKLALEGDNPSLTSGVVVGGADIDARNGIITNHSVGTFNNLTVSKVRVKDVYLRGIYASSGGSFNFNHDIVDNVQGEEASIAMFNFEGAGSMTFNKVSNANDAISANWSKGTQFIGNKVIKSGSGVHTDNNGGSGGEADSIKDNKISECNLDGYGIFVFVPYVSATVEANKVTGCAVGLAAFGGAVSGQGPSFVGNRIDGTGASASESLTYGALLTTDQLGFGFGDVTASLSSNRLEHTSTGVLVTQPAGGQATVSGTNNIIHMNSTGANGATGTVVELQDNWWGCKQGPNNSPRCDTAVGTVNYTPWLTEKP